MRTVRLTLAYDGTSFRGWARQRDQRTVQGVLEEALSRVLGAVPRLSAAGRTDAGVHARGQVVSFARERDTDVERMRRSLNAMLAPEVVVVDGRIAPDGFDARFSASAREYRYRIDVGETADPFTARFVWHRPGALSTTRMR
ncbi:MAG: tRNA pseudouridine synthase A, partial [Solirubrobacterales bacterium]